jgi:hypothetical protein
MLSLQVVLWQPAAAQLAFLRSETSLLFGPALGDKGLGGFRARQGYWQMNLNVLLLGAVDLSSDSSGSGQGNGVGAPIQG